MSEETYHVLDILANSKEWNWIWKRFKCIFRPAGVYVYRDSYVMIFTPYHCIFVLLYKCFIV